MSMVLKILYQNMTHLKQRKARMRFLKVNLILALFYIYPSRIILSISSPEINPFL